MLGTKNINFWDNEKYVLTKNQHSINNGYKCLKNFEKDELIHKKYIKFISTVEIGML